MLTVIETTWQYVSYLTFQAFTPLPKFALKPVFWEVALPQSSRCMLGITQILTYYEEQSRS